MHVLHVCGIVGVVVLHHGVVVLPVLMLVLLLLLLLLLFLLLLLLTLPLLLFLLLGEASGSLPLRLTAIQSVGVACLLLRRLLLRLLLLLLLLLCCCCRSLSSLCGPPFSGTQTNTHAPTHREL